MPPSRITADDLHAVTDGLTDLVGEIRRLSDKQSDGATELKAVCLRLETLTTSVQRLETQYQTSHVTRVLGTLERAPWQVGTLLAAILLVLVLIAGHVDIVALAAAYGRKGTP